MLRCIILSCVLFWVGCKPQVLNKSTSAVQGTQEHEGDVRCGTILPSVDKILTEYFKQIVLHAKNNPGSQMRSRVLARQTVTMIKNMTLDKANPIHPVAFFAMVKDFESGTNMNWGQGGVSSTFIGGNCGPVTCYSLFQTDVLGDGNWADGQVVVTWEFGHFEVAPTFVHRFIGGIGAEHQNVNKLRQEEKIHV